MITIIQRVTMAKVTVNHQDVAEIDVGIMALLAVEKEDTVKGKLGKTAKRAALSAKKKQTVKK